jgi:distribution and morphology protein 31
LDIKFPHGPHDDLPFNAILGEIADAISTSLSGTFPDAEKHNPELNRIPGQRELARPPLTAPPVERNEDERWGGAEENLKIVVDIDLRFRDLKAAVPIFTNDLSYVNNAFIRPIVAFMKYVRLP